MAMAMAMIHLISAISDWFIESDHRFIGSSIGSLPHLSAHPIIECTVAGISQR
jgi:hypothetical protein